MTNYYHAALDAVVKARAQSRKQNNIPFSEELEIREGYECRKLALINVLKTRKSMGSAILEALWDEEQAQTYRHFEEEMGSLREWADTVIAPQVYEDGDDKSFLYDMVFIVERVMRYVFQYENSKTPMKLPDGTVITVAYILENIEKLGLISKLKVISPDIVNTPPVKEAPKTEPIKGAGRSVLIEEAEEEFIHEVTVEISEPEANHKNNETLISATLSPDMTREKIMQLKRKLRGDNPNVITLPKPEKAIDADTGARTVIYHDLTPEQEELLNRLTASVTK